MEHFGPASYQTGGEVFAAKPLGFSGIEAIEPLNKGLLVFTKFGIDFVMVPLSFSRNYFVEVLFAVNGEGAVADVTIRWGEASSLAEVPPGTDLSAEKVRLLVLGV